MLYQLVLNTACAYHCYSDWNHVLWSVPDGAKITSRMWKLRSVVSPPVGDVTPNLTSHRRHHLAIEKKRLTGAHLWGHTGAHVSHKYAN